MLRFLICVPVVFAASFAVAEIPPVVLSTQHQAMCLVGVGDNWPKIELSGQAEDNALRMGTAATVIAVVGQDHWMNQQLLADLPKDVAATFGEQGVTANVIFVGREPRKEERAESLVTLVDGQSNTVKALGTGRMPRVYVLDAKGAIRWLDIEYSRSTRRELGQTLQSLTTK